VSRAKDPAGRSRPRRRAGAAPSTAVSAKPECPPDAPPTFNCVIAINDDFVDSKLCTFDIHIVAVGKVGYAPRHDRDGNLIGEAFTPNIKITLTNEANGRFLTDRDVGLDKATFNPDGSIDILSTGIHFKVRAGDGGMIFRRIGLQIIHIDSAGNETVEIKGGNFDPEEEFQGLVCGYLAGD
jgi:hypothetical protein